MSLKVWLPLDGTLENKGTSNVTVTSINSSSTTGGKIGTSCYSFNNTTSRLLVDNPIGNGVLQFSMCAWVKVTQWQSNVCGIFGARTTGSGKGLLCSIKSTQIIFDDGTRFTINGTYSEYENQWIHMAFIKTPTKKCVYINGELIGSQNNASATSTVKSQLTIGGDSYEAYTGNGLYGLLNDVRIYDHALSTAEVHELAQGLVMHYKLSAENLIDKNTLTADNYINASGGLKGTSNWYASDYIPVFYGKTYQTFDLSHGGSGTCVALYNSSNVFKRSITIVANENLTITPNADESYIRLSIRNIGGELAIAKFVEVTDIARDSSGYGRHGTQTAVSVFNDTPRYNCCSSFNGTSSNIKIPFTNALGIASEINIPYSVSMWFRKDDNGGDAYSTLLGANGFEIDTKNNTKTNTLIAWNWGKGTYTYENNVWYHFAMTNDTTATKWYINGELFYTGTSTTLKTGDYFIGAWKTASQQNYLGYISDVRIYATNLSADDIQELYRVGLKIDKRSGMHTYELQEGQNQLRPTAQGLLQCEHLEEDEKASFYKDKHIEASQIIEM